MNSYKDTNKTEIDYLAYAKWLDQLIAMGTDIATVQLVDLKSC